MQLRWPKRPEQNDDLPITIPDIDKRSGDDTSRFDAPDSRPILRRCSILQHTYFNIALEL